MSTLRTATIYQLQIPFVESFTHHTAQRRFCDSVVVKVVDDAGVEGFGEGVPRPYVTGENPAFMIDHLAHTLLPSVLGRELPLIQAPADLAQLDEFVDPRPPVGVRSDNACRSALELAMLDCCLRRQGTSAAALFAVGGHTVIYSGIISAGALDTALAHARQMKLIGLQQIKIKVGYPDDVARVRAIRELFGPTASIRLDANGAWTLPDAVEMLGALAAFDIAAVEQPLAAGAVDDLVRLRQATPIVIVVDESLVTVADADELIERGAVDVFNIRVSKCGGLWRALEIARRAERGGVGVQIGAQVGETAILSAAGRLIAASVSNPMFVEGSYGTLLLVEDIGAEEVRFGRRGRGRVLGGPGLGLSIREDRLRKHSADVVEVRLPVDAR
ncbi:MAG: enolase C-terminal domain-like protein [Acidimicrobiales bacterium]